MSIARLTPAFATDREGSVHSVFEHVVNAGMRLDDGMRLLTLTAPCLPRLPDSVVVEQDVLDACELGMPVALRGDCLHVGDLCVALAREEYPPLAPLAGQPRTADLLAATATLASGFDRIPQELRLRATQALCTLDAPRYIGLGWGLTPSYDDACVGVMATCRALGREAPFVIGELQATTDVSARYLRLAREGYFGEPLMLLMRALFGQGSMEDALRGLLAVGATSGADTVYGVAAALRQL